MMPSSVASTGLQVLIAKAESDLFSSMGDQSILLAEAWSNLRQSAALLAGTDRGVVPPERLREAIDHAQAAIRALQTLTER
ncbi:MAG: hypothetical protein H0V44_09330 [Planctomycetes bacterium]|nr:hypothetical protein [Planctomycetota bacterium]